MKREHVAVIVTLGAAAAAIGGYVLLHEEAQWWAVRVGDRTIGAEKVILTRTDDGVHLVRNGWIAAADGHRKTEIDVMADPDGHLRGSDGYALELLAPTLADGASIDVNAVDLYAHQGHSVRVSRAGDVVTAASTEGDGFVVTLHVQGDRVVRMTRGPVESLLVPMRPLVAPYDASVFEHEVPAVADARDVHHAEFTLDGAPVVVDTPIALELPPSDVERLRRFVASARAAGGDCQVQARAVAASAGAEGLSAKVIEGWAYSDADGTPALVPHAWTVVEGVAVDPALDQPVANALRVPAPRGEAWFAEHQVRLVTAR